MLQLDGAALASRRDDGRVELVQPMRLAPVGAATGAASGGVVGMLLLEPVGFAAVGAVAGAAGRGSPLRSVAGPGRDRSFALARLGANALERGDRRQAEELCRRALATAEAASTPWAADAPRGAAVAT